MSGEEHLQNSDNLLLKRCESLQDDSFNLAFPFKLEDDFYFSVQSENAKPQFSSAACNSTNHWKGSFQIYTGFQIPISNDKWKEISQIKP